MAGATTKYAFPYPLGTDPISDGDDQIKALAERVEAVLGTNRSWQAVRGTDAAMPAVGTWGMAVSLTLTGCPVGSTVLVIGRVEVSAGGVATNVSSRYTLTGATDNLSPGLGSGVSAAANYYVSLTTFTVITVTVANPVVAIEAMVGQAAGTLRAASTLFAGRIT
jgi:hypothetical protein